MSRLHPPILICLFLLLCQPASAQRDDSIRLARRIEAARPGGTFIEGARELLRRELLGTRVDEAARIVAFMNRRPVSGEGSWISPMEELDALIIISNRSLVTDTARLEDLLRRSYYDRGGAARFDDRLLETEDEYIGLFAPSIIERFERHRPTEVERGFHLLLVNSRIVRGLRARWRQNDDIDAFVARHGGTSHARLAGTYLRRDVEPATIGAAFTAGYSSAWFDGDLGRRLDGFHGPALGGEIDINRFVLSGNVLIGVANAPAPFVAAGSSWHHGHLPLVSASLDLGYELRLGMMMFTPMVGIGGVSMSGDEAEYEESPPSTLLRVGWDAAVMVTYRVPSDVGPHFDLRFRIGRSALGLSQYDSDLSGGMLYAQLGFALVRRPYE